MEKLLISTLLVIAIVPYCALASSDVGAYEGVWTYESYILILERLDEAYCVTIYAPERPEEITQWIYPECSYDDVADELNTVENGVKTHIVYDDAGEIVLAEEYFRDGAASFKLTEDDTLIWTDYKETPGENEITFARADDIRPVPTVEVILSEYIRPVAALEEGTAGSSMKLAQATAGAALFAVRYEMWNPDADELTSRLAEGLSQLSGEELAAFTARFESIRALTDDCLEHWDANAGLFEDAGVIEDMNKIVFDPLNRLAATNLLDMTQKALAPAP